MTFLLLMSLIQTQAFALKEPAVDLAISSEAVAPDTSLKIKSSGVPAFDFIHRKSGTRVTHLPRLKLGQESRLRFQSHELDLAKSPNKAPQVFRKLPSPHYQPEQNLSEKYQLSNIQAPQLKLIESSKKIPSGLEFKEIPSPRVSEVQIRLREIQTLSAAEMKLLQALIFLEIHQNHGLAFGLLSELLRDSKETRIQAAFHLGLSAKALGLYSEFKYQLTRILREASPDWQKLAAQTLAQGAEPGDLALVRVLDPKLEELQFEVPGDYPYQINRARFFLEKNDLSSANSALAKISEGSPLWPETRMLQALLSYREGQIESALRFQKEAFQSIEKLRPKSDLKSAIALTLARMQFQVGDYKQAFQSYLEVAKNHAEWPQAMIEQAWAQILMKDPEGAAGNMFSLHTDFLKHRFAPESYVARAVGYLNLCQYGDGLRVVYDFKKRYEPMAQLMSEFSKKKNQSSDFYELIHQVFRQPDQKLIAGLPRSLIVDLARHPNFISSQSLINGIEDQIVKFNGLTLSIIQSEREMIRRQSEMQAALGELRKKQKKSEYESEIQNLERNILGLKSQQVLAKKARDSIKDLRTQALVRMESEKKEFKSQAARSLQLRYKEMEKRLSHTLEQSELLAYEIYSGAGEHLRLQLAGGEAKPQGQLSVQKGSGKSLKWEFKGEVWEDELGHYRSSLKNVCGQEDRMANGGN